MSKTLEQIAKEDLRKVLLDKEDEELRVSMRKKRTRDSLSVKERRQKILYEYAYGSDVNTLSTKYSLHPSDIRRFINERLEALINYKERDILKESGHDKKEKCMRSLQKLKDSELITENFLTSLSDSNDPILTDEEALFAQLYVRTGDSQEAIQGSNLDDGLIETRGPSYKRGILIRSSYLREKPNIKEYISTLREDLFSTNDISKQRVQELLVEEIYKMKEKGDPRDKINLRQTIELLGKTIGAFTEKVEIHEVDPSKSLDALIEMAKEAEVRELENPRGNN